MTNRTRPEPGPEERRESSGNELEDLLQRGFRYALALSHDPDCAKDLLQDAWVAVLAARGPWTAGYLFTAIRSRFIDQYRRQMLVVMEPVADEEAMANLAGGEREEERIRVELLSLNQALQVLRSEEREAIFLAAVEGLSAREIAKVTRRPRGTVLSLIFRARRKLVRFLAEAEAVGKP